MTTEGTRRSLEDLCAELAPISHTDECIEKLREFSASHGKTKNVQAILLEPSALLKEPVLHVNCLSAGVATAEEPFVLLQADVVYTEAAYFLGVRKDGPNAHYVVANSTCDLVAGRREHATIFPIDCIFKPSNQKEKETTQALLKSILSFRSSMYMFLPRFDWQSEDRIAGNLIDFTRPHQINMDTLLLSKREYSMTEVGWRIFSSVYRYISSREAAGEADIRNHVIADANEDVA